MNKYWYIWKKCKEKAQKDLCELQTLIKDYVSGDVVVYRQEDLDSKEKIQETIGIVEDEIKAFETEISLRENEDIPKNFDSNYSKTCYAIQSLERLIEIMKEYSVKESRGQPKSGALKQATCKGNF